MTSLPLSSITVRKDRQRRAVGDCSDLIESIQRLGLITPICLTRDNVLIAGERRLFSMKKLGWETLEHGRHFVYRDEVDFYTLEAIELEENVKRKDLSWEEEVRAVVRYHNHRVKGDEEWTQTSTANALGIDKSTVSRSLLVFEHAKKDGSIWEAQKLSVAVNTAERARSREQQSRLENILDEPSPALDTGRKQQDVARAVEVSGAVSAAPDRKPAEQTSSIPSPILHADALSFFPSYTGPRFNFLHCDFPYGIDFDKQPRMNSTNMESYPDSFDVYQTLVRDLLPSLPIADNAHMMFWFSMKHFVWTKLELMKQGWIVDDYPLVWFRSDGKGMIPDTARRGRYVYETAFHCTRGDRKIVRPVNNLCPCPRGEVEHSSSKPEPMLEHFLRMYVDESTYILDPTCRSGSALRVARRLGAKHLLGIERDEDFYLSAQKLWAEQKNVDFEL